MCSNEHGFFHGCVCVGGGSNSGLLVCEQSLLFAELSRPAYECSFLTMDLDPRKLSFPDGGGCG